ncbi:ATP-binding protein [Psychrobacter urativorans]|uniref:ATP-binding protein n=1 Tax=Psychrobacter urativorans TaxID=45610 RepID=UPI001919BAFF|nr:ATP-binding protein [Psychrobacter urativorans]
MKISKIILENFKAFAGRHELDTNKPVVFLVGENNTGKTTVFKAIDFLRSGAPRDKTIDDYKNANHKDKHVSVTIEIEGNLEQSIENFSEVKYLPYVVTDDGTQRITLKRTSEEYSVQQGKKSVDINIRKITVYNSVTDQFENPTGFDKAINTLFEVVSIWSDMDASELTDFGSTKTLGKLLKDVCNNFETSSNWNNFLDAHNVAFTTGEDSLLKQSQHLVNDIQKSLGEFYGEATVSFDFKPPEPSSFVKLGDIIVNDGIETNISEKGSGMQRAFALAVMKVYADFLVKHPSNADLKKPLFFFIDEPEISLHPRAQMTLIKSIITISEHQQVFLTTHSPFLLKHFASNDICTYMTKKNNQSAQANLVESMQTFSFSPTLAEINYFTYEICSTDFHNELYGYISDITNSNMAKKFDQWVEREHSIIQDMVWIKDNGNGRTNPINLTLMSYIRHSIHHPENTYNRAYTEEEIQTSTQKMVSIINSNTFQTLLSVYRSSAIV